MSKEKLCAIAAFKPCTPIPPKRRGDTGKTPLPKTAFEGKNRYVNTSRKTGNDKSLGGQ